MNWVIGKKYQYRNGEKCRVVADLRVSCPEFDGLHPIISYGAGGIRAHKGSGRFFDNVVDAYDLMPEKVEGWVNIYIEQVYATPELAAAGSWSTRTACIHISYLPGEGL
jgi:hypothetical protein